MNNVEFRYSDSNFSAYLMYLGYSPIGFDIVEKRGNKPKVFIHFEGNKEILIKLQQEYKNNNVKLNLIEYGKCKNNILKLVRQQLHKYFKK
jgi:hypothetical protein